MLKLETEKKNWKLKLLYTSPLWDIIKRHKLDFYFYPDDTQIYFAFKPNSAEQQ